MFGSRKHGGPAFEDGFFERLVRAGFAVASVDYRLSGEAIFTMCGRVSRICRRFSTTPWSSPRKSLGQAPNRPI